LQVLVTLRYVCPDEFLLSRNVPFMLFLCELNKLNHLGSGDQLNKNNNY